MRVDLKTYLAEKGRRVDEALHRIFPEPEGPAGDLIRAMTYSLFAGGKRLRPILCIAGAEACGGQGESVLPVACALELIHTYSLIHDDLPVMDNDDMRRGRPTSHRVFGEAVALLAGDGLLTEALRLMAEGGRSAGLEPQKLLTVIELIGWAAGYQGMVGGQVVDIQFEGKSVSPPLVEYIHTHKTAAMIAASVTSGAILGGGNEDQVKAVRSYGDSIGLAFQIADDVLDIEGDSMEMGKGVGGDEKRKKITYPSVLGLARAKEIMKELVRKAGEALEGFDHGADPLRLIASYIIERKK